MNIQRGLKSNLLKRNSLLAISGILTGIAGGFLYYHFIGCRTGTCPITSNPWISMLWGAAVGYLLFDLFRKKETPAVHKDKEPVEEK